MVKQGVVVVGGGHGGFHTALFLRKSGFEDPITLIDAQARLPYQRPPLSKEFLHGKQELIDTQFRPASFYEEHRITVKGGIGASGIDCAQKIVELEGGEAIGYDELVLATGSRPRPLPVPGAELPGVLHLAVAEDAAELRNRIANAGRVVVIGGGFIGLEAAAMAAEAGKAVSVLEATDRLMGRVVTEPVSRFFEQLHRAHGVNVELLSEVTALEGDASGVQAVLTADGTSYPADVVVVGIGAVPHYELAAAAGLETDNGIVVGPTLQTSDPHIYAIGDCARFHTRFSHAAATVRLESVQNAVDQAKLVAMQLHQPAAKRAYDAVPWFWTVQFGHRLQIAGLTLGYDRTEQVGEEDGRFSIYSYLDEVFIGCESVNMPRDHVRARKELATQLISVGGPEPRP